MARPLVLDLDGSVGPLPSEQRIALREWQEAIRFGCALSRLRAFERALVAQLPARHGTAFLGSGDFHHLTWPLIARRAAQAPFDVVVFDNHPDNMRFPFGVHCGSWVWRVARLPCVARVDVLGISSSDVSAAHAWENHLLPLARGRLRYWTVGVDTRWARRFGLGDAFLAFDTPADLLDRFVAGQRGSTRSVYLSIDKDALDPAVARTNWDQGRLRDGDLFAAIDVLRGRIVGSDITGEVSSHHYETWWKRRLSAFDAQPAVDPERLAAWQAQQHALNLRLLDHIQAAAGDDP